MKKTTMSEVKNFLMSPNLLTVYSGMLILTSLLITQTPRFVVENQLNFFLVLASAVTASFGLTLLVVAARKRNINQN